MAGLKSLAKDTAIYGLSSILGKFLNWCFVFLYINVLRSTSDYGIVTNLYAYMALLLIILTYGMETGFFRFANDKNCDNPMRVYSTTLISIASTSSLFIAITALLLNPISKKSTPLCNSKAHKHSTEYSLKPILLSAMPLYL